MSENNKVVKAGLGYTLGNILIKGINFLVLPLFSRIMSTAEFGVYNVFLSYDGIVSVLVGLALHSSVRSAHYEFKGKTDDYVSSITLIYLLNALLYMVLIWIGSGWLVERTGFSHAVLLMLIPFSFGGAILQLYNERISLDYSYKKYLRIALINSAGNVIFSLILIYTAFNHQRDVGRILGTTGTIFLIAMFLIASMYHKAVPRFNKEYWKFGIKYSLPIVPHGISQVLLAQCDRIMISSMVSASAAGIYSLAGNLKLILTVISTSIGVSWSTWFFSEMSKGEHKDIQKNAKHLVMMFAVFTIGLMMLAPEISLILGGKEYVEAKYVAIPMVADAFILFVYNIIVPSEYYTKKTVYIMTGTLVAAVINLITNYIFIKQYGYIAAAYTTLFSYVCYLILHIAISYRLVKFNVIPIKWVLSLSGLVAVMAAYDLMFVNQVILRLICGLIVAGAMGIYLLKRTEIVSKFIHRNNA